MMLDCSSSASQVKRLGTANVKVWYSTQALEVSSLSSSMAYSYIHSALCDFPAHQTCAIMTNKNLASARANCQNLHKNAGLRLRHRNDRSQMPSDLPSHPQWECSDFSSKLHDFGALSATGIHHNWELIDMQERYTKYDIMYLGFASN